MIRPIDIRLNAAHPELPLVEATTFTGAPSSVFIRGVPRAVGNWSITAVNVAVTFPDNSTTTRAAVESAEGVWVATIPGTATSGRTEAGFRVLADGIDENGAAVTGYVLGFADFSVFSFLPVPAPGETYYLLRYFDTMPTAAKKMDVTTIDGDLKYYDGTAWQPFADLSNCATKADATLNARYSAWTVTVSGGAPDATVKWQNGHWVFDWGAGENETSNTNFNALSIEDEVGVYSATRTVLPGYVLGSQTDKPVASEAEAEALRNGKQDALSAQQLANIAAVPDKLDKSGGSGAKIEWVYPGQNNATLVITFANGKMLVFDYDGYSIDTVATRLWIAAQGFMNRLTSYFTPGNLASLTLDGGIADSGVKASDKLDASSASAPFSDDNTVQYPVGSHCTYNGKLYRCTTATTGGTWLAASWTAEDMTAFVQNRIGQKLEVWLSVNPQTGVVSANYDDGL